MNALGIDTSCYRTSLALAGDVGLLQRRRLLAVRQGERGLQQSEGVFQHAAQLGALMEELMGGLEGASIDCVCASGKPRPADGSYMPVFMVGASFGRALASAIRVPFFETTHQQGHIRAALVGAGVRGKEFLALHLSGGTTEVLRVGDGLSIARLGGTEDLHAGQLVDRVGVRLGLPFPAGPYLEELAARGQAKSRVPASVRGLNLSFSGAEAQLMRLIEGGLSAEDAAAEVYSALARAAAKLLQNAAREAGLSEILLAGGVASSQLFRRLLTERMARDRFRGALCWADPELAGDNAAGDALIGLERLSAGK